MTIAAIGVLPNKDGRELSASERRLLEAVGNQAAVAIERVILAEDIDQARLGAERERLRSVMLTSVSHDLRTPLASIIGSLFSLLSYGERYDAGTRLELDVYRDVDGDNAYEPGELHRGTLMIR